MKIMLEGCRFGFGIFFIYVMVFILRGIESWFLFLRIRCLKYLGLFKGCFIYEFLYLKYMFYFLIFSLRYLGGRNYLKMGFLYLGFNNR